MDSYNTVTWAEGGNLSQQIPDKHNPVRQKIPGKILFHYPLELPSKYFYNP